MAIQAPDLYFTESAGFTVPTPSGGNRQAGVLSDGSHVWLQSRRGIGLFLYHRDIVSGAITEIEQISISLPPESSYCLAVAPDDDIHVLWTTNDNGAVIHERYNKGVGATWTSATGTEVVYDMPVSQFVGNMDADVLDSGAVILGFNLADESSNRVSFEIWIRTTGGSWAHCYSYDAGTVGPADQNATSGSLGELCTIARDAGGAISGKQRFVFATRPSRNYVVAGMEPVFGSFRVDLGTGVVDAFLNWDGGGMKNYLGASIQGCLFAVAPEEWVFLGTTGNSVQGDAGMTCHAMRFHIEPDGSVPAEITAGPVSSTGQSDTTPATSSQVATQQIRPVFSWLGSANKGVVVAVSSTGVYYKVVSFEDPYEETPSWGPSRRLFATSFPVTEIKGGANRNFNSDLAGAYTYAMSFILGSINSNFQGQYHHFRKVAPASTPTNISPSAGSTITTDIPTLSARAPAGQISSDGSGTRTRMQWEVADDNLFTTNVKSITSEHISNSSFTVTFNQEIPVSQQLSQGTRHIKARLLDEMNAAGPWSTPHTFIVSHPPSIVPISPTGGVYLVYTEGDVEFVFAFTDPSPVDTMTAREVTVERNSDATIVASSGKSVGNTESLILNIPDTEKDIELRWRGRPWDSDDVVGDYSTYSLFKIGDPLEVEITSPGSGSTVTTPNPLIEWSVISAGGRTQAAYRVYYTRNLDSVVVYDTGWLSGSTNQYQADTAVLETEKDYTVHLELIDTGGIKTETSVEFSVEFVGPVAPSFAVDSSVYRDSGYHKVMWDNSDADEAFVAWRLYRRPVGSSSWILLDEIEVNQTDYEYHDWFAASGFVYEYGLSQVALRFGVPVEGVITISDPVSDVNSSYYLIPETVKDWPHASELQIVKLEHVTSDNLAPEYEEEVLLLMDRGRKVDVGTYWGYSGSLGGEIRDIDGGKTARLQRLEIEFLKELGTTVFLRNPFGDIIPVSISIQLNRIPGTGLQEATSYTITYTEIVED